MSKVLVGDLRQLRALCTEWIKVCTRDASTIAELPDKVGSMVNETLDFCVATKACVGDEIFTKHTYEIWKRVSSVTSRLAEGESGFWARETFATCRTDPEFDKLDREAMRVAGGELHNGEIFTELNAPDCSEYTMAWCLGAAERVKELQQTIRPAALLGVESRILAFCKRQVEEEVAKTLEEEVAKTLEEVHTIYGRLKIVAKTLEEVRTIAQTWTTLDRPHQCLDAAEKLLHQATTVHHSITTSMHAVFLAETARTVKNYAEDEMVEACLDKVADDQITAAAAFLHEGDFKGDKDLEDLMVVLMQRSLAGLIATAKDVFFWGGQAGQFCYGAGRSALLGFRFEAIC